MMVQGIRAVQAGMPMAVQEEAALFLVPVRALEQGASVPLCSGCVNLNATGDARL